MGGFHATAESFTAFVPDFAFHVPELLRCLLTCENFLDTCEVFIQFFFQVIFYLFISHYLLLKRLDHRRLNFISISKPYLAKPNRVMNSVNQRIQAHFGNPISIQIDLGESVIVVGDELC